MIQSDKVGAALLELATSETMQLSWPEGTVTNELPNGMTAPGVCLVIRHWNARLFPPKSMLVVGGHAAQHSRR